MSQKSALISLLADRPVAYHPDLARILGGVKQAIFVSQLLYWTDKGSRADGFIWKTQEEWTDETGLSAGEQRTARKHLVEQGILIERLQDIPARLYYKLNLDTLQARMEEYYEQDMTIPHNLESETPPAIPEITTEITTEEKPAPDGDDFSDLFDKPNGKPITTNLPTTDDPLVLANHTAERRKQEKVYTVPADAGGADDWDVTVQAWGKLISKETSEMGQGTRIKLAQIFQQVGAVTGHTAPEVARAIGRFKDEYEWWNDTWPGDGFCNRLGMLLVPDTADPERNLATSGYKRVEPVSGW